MLGCRTPDPTLAGMGLDARGEVDARCFKDWGLRVVVYVPLSINRGGVEGVLVDRGIEICCMDCYYTTEC